MFLFFNLNPCCSFHLFLAETNFSLLTSVVSGFYSSNSICFKTLWIFFWYSGEVFSLTFFAISYMRSLYEALRHSGTRYSGTNSVIRTPSESIFFLRRLIYLTRTYFSLRFSAKYDLRSGDLSIFFLKSSCWKRSILWFPRTVQRSLILYLKASSYFLEMGNYFFLTVVNFYSSNFMN